MYAVKYSMPGQKSYSSNSHWLGCLGRHGIVAMMQTFVKN
jgi:hypothetical protein